MWWISQPDVARVADYDYAGREANRVFSHGQVPFLDYVAPVPSSCRAVLDENGVSYFQRR